MLKNDENHEENGDDRVHKRDTNLQKNQDCRKIRIAEKSGLQKNQENTERNNDMNG